MNKNVLLAAALLVAVGGGVALVVTQGGETEGMATGKGSKADQLWTRMMEYEDSYLSDWLGAYDKTQPAPMDVLEAWNEIALQITGPGGFWRRHVPDRWLGCRSLPDSAPCDVLALAEESEFLPYENLTTQIHAMEPKKARRFLARNFDTMMDYLDTYVPEELSSPAMQKTKFFEKGLKGAMEQDGML